MFSIWYIYKWIWMNFVHSSRRNFHVNLWFGYQKREVGICGCFNSFCANNYVSSVVLKWAELTGPLLPTWRRICLYWNDWECVCSLSVKQVSSGYIFLWVNRHCENLSSHFANNLGQAIPFRWSWTIYDNDEFSKLWLDRILFSWH